MKILEHFSKPCFLPVFLLCILLRPGKAFATLLNKPRSEHLTEPERDSQRQLNFSAAQVKGTHASRTKTISYTTEVQLLGWTHSLLFYSFKHSWLSTLLKKKKLIWKTYFYSSNINILYSPFCCKDTRLIYMFKKKKKEKKKDWTHRIM